MVSTENWWHGTDCRGKAVRAPLTDLGPKVTAWDTARPGRPEIHIQSGHKSPCLRLSSSCHDTNSNFRRSHETAIFFRYKCQSQCLFEHASDMVCSTAVRDIQLSCNGRCTSTLRSPTWTVPCHWDRHWEGHGVSYSKSRLNDTWQFALDTVKEKFSTRRLATVADIKTATRECSNYCQLST
jgi:hypothetical protein